MELKRNSGLCFVFLLSVFDMFAEKPVIFEDAKVWNPVVEFSENADGAYNTWGDAAIDVITMLQYHW